MKRYLITSALPYANGPIHIGHLAGAYLPADIYTRFLKFKGFDAIHICGTDEHGVAITLAAYKEGVAPKELVDKYHERIKNDFKLMGIEFDHFSRTTNPIHYKVSQEFFLTLHKNGYLEKRKMKQFYSPAEGKFLPDRYIVGKCPYCGYEEARGDQCEKCGRQLEPTQLINPRSAISGVNLELRETVHWFFKLSLLKDKLEEWLNGKGNWKPFVKEFALSWVKELEDRAITRDLDWGVPVPLDDPDAKGKVLYVWFDAPIGYISATVEFLPDKWQDYWKNPDTKIIHFIGKDNIVFHTVIWPAMLMAHGEYNLPSDVPANAFLNLMGRKLSTSRGYAIWADELATVGQDIARYSIALYIPEKDDSDFNVIDAFNRTNAELVDSFGNLAQRVLTFINGHFSGSVPHPDKILSEDEQIFNYISEKVKSYEENLINFNFRLALKDAVEVSNELNRYFEHQRPWKLVKENPERAKTVLYVAYQGLKVASALFYPYVPSSVKILWDYMNISGNFDDLTGISPELSGNTVKKSQPLYKKVDKSVIDGWVEILNQRVAGVEEKDERITYEEFKKVKLVVGKVLDAERVKGADKLLKLKVDLGKEVRTIVAGIAEKYRPEDVVGKKIVVVSNLQKKKIRGIESDGMLLAATDGDGKPILITPEGDVPEGSEVS